MAADRKERHRRSACRRQAIIKVREMAADRWSAHT